MTSHNSASYVSLRSLQQEVLSVAGWYDGVNINVPYNHSNDLLVTYHENVHARIARECPDGVLLSALIKATKYALLQEQQAEKINNLIFDLFDSASIAHEVAATYLSVKVFDLDKHNLMLMKYPPAYQDYYQQMSTVIENQIKSSYLQYLIGWNSAVVAFSSPFPERFLANLPEIAYPDTDVERPDWRMAHLLEVLRMTDTQVMLREANNIIEQVAQTYAFPAWDAQDEQGWEAAFQAGVSDHANLALSNYIRPWLCEISGLDAIDFTEQTANQLQRFFQSMNIEFQFVPAIRSLADKENETILQAREASISKIINPGKPYIVRLAQAIPHLRLDHQIGVGGYGPKHNLFDVIAVTDNHQERGIYVQSDDSEIHYLLNHAAITPVTGIPRIKVIVLAIQSNESILEWTTRLSNFIISLGQPRINDYSSEVVWYISGDYIDWLQNTRELTSIFRAEVRSNLYEGGGCAIHILEDPRSGSLYMRLFNLVAAQHIRNYEDMLVKRGKLKYMDNESFKRHQKKIVLAMDVVTLMWDTF